MAGRIRGFVDQRVAQLSLEYFEFHDQRRCRPGADYSKGRTMILFTRRDTLTLLLVAAPTFVTGAAKAAADSWDGVWDGAMPDGATVQVTISGPSVTNYKYKGQDITINSQRVAPKSVLFTVGTMNAQIKMLRTGKKSANWFYNEPNGFANHTGVHLQ
jgi:hypothetical protein